MNVPVETKPALWGAAAGAITLAIVGFSWGGWVTGGKFETETTQKVSTALVTALAPVCVEKFQRAADAAGNLAALKKADSWARGEVIEKGGWATMPGENPPGQASAVAKACAAMLVPS